jgi:hypothetical protein
MPVFQNTAHIMLFEMKENVTHPFMGEPERSM